MVSKTTNLTGYSVSEICGNVSFVFVCVAYLNTDILMLRVLSTGSIALSILFQYYRAIPLWIPIRWNVLLLAINSVMTVSLIAERQMANNMPGELAGTYTNGLFEARGLSKVEFVRLFSRAQKITLRKREKLAQDGQVNRRLFFVVEGAVQIQQRGKRIAKVTPYHFIGEMSFLHFLLDDECPTTSKKKCPDTMATADAVAETDTVVAYVWDFENLRDYLQGEREVRNALSAYMNYDLRAKLSLLNTTAARRRTSHKNKKL
ncbi:cNMP [Seminavis robusta]|uniref:CNMP n=1 Tax=Seminavis robusta TaxID=568900 RepID=A0A9N8DGY3_9STRA|nr:cNMP [Seminavis robusta]|eukprot:Sro82_g043700.1 cNMP (261) ;mRNA; f:12981-13903